MHELSIASNIVEIAEDAIREYPGKTARKIILEIGLLSGIDFEALQFALEVVTANTPLHGVEREILKIEPEAECQSCKTIFRVTDFFDHCPACGGYQFLIKRGKELLVKSIELEDGTPT
jgi:hydrogenase nickel incorporation protein HypA/HybF